MYPTYSGMNEVIYELNAEKPTTTENILNKILLGSKNYYLEAGNDGRVSVPLFSRAQFSRDAKLRSLGVVSFEYVKGKNGLDCYQQPTGNTNCTLEINQ